ncbi:aspartyl-phosphate phosphatase Spo0E family protein [Metabacillus arenae]|uniref:Aspartyl-phosphate phosphatase Spo0E family protein n=1 Tax=Metabacillus arenae TaxID=2771434 RepID=A0A926NB46_9BACI|nr:aspartyl-phosphate phosphatase Spo0E family protein [Metabacillus arenae]MBD1380977.1 aspartyl-phosphate phosphatase Spo0E family protein [Metabacillus arenae]
MIFIDIGELGDRINQLKKELNHIAEETGLNSLDTIFYSQKLDQLITIYQKLSIKNENKNMLLNDNKSYKN